MTIIWTVLHEGFLRTLSDRLSLGAFFTPQIGAFALFSTHINMSMILVGIGVVGGIIGIVKNSIEAYRQYLLMKKEIKEFDKIDKIDKIVEKE